MDLKTGDFVRFVDEDLEGTITSFQENGLVGVTDSDGFEIPVPLSKVTLVYGQRDKKAEKESGNDNKQPAAQRDFIKDGVYLAITGEGQSALAEFYLVNDTSYELLAGLSCEEGPALRGEFAAVIDPLSFQKVYTANVASSGSWPVFVFQVLFFTKQAQPGKAPLTVRRRIRPADLSSAKKPVGQLGKKAWLFRLDESVALPETAQLKEHFMSHRPFKK